MNTTTDSVVENVDTIEVDYKAPQAKTDAPNRGSIVLIQGFWSHSDLEGVTDIELLETEVKYNVYASTGRVDESLEKELFRNTGAQIGGLNSLDEFYARPEWVSPPRKVSLGLNMTF